jgi:hypothetical protein
MIHKTKQILRKLQALARRTKSEIRLIFSKTVNVSLGENCLTDNILERHGVKSFTSPYAHGRSNLDYATQLESRSYSGLLDQDKLSYEILGEKQVVRNRSKLSCDPIFTELHRNGFEFTHHDVIKNQKHRESFKRKINRLQKYRGKKKFRFFYHYRYSEFLDLDSIERKAKDFLEFYNRNIPSCEFIVFTQKIIAREKPRRIEFRSYDERVTTCIFYTYDVWSGDDGNLFWARVDDDLIGEMLQRYKAEQGYF